jgi:hypothetical protein
MSATGSSRYHSLQLQYRARVGSSVHALASYTFSDAKDTTSIGAIADRALVLAPSDFDLRHAFNAGLSWLPSASGKSAAWLLDGWGLHALVTARSGYPFSVYTVTQFTSGTERFRRRASLMPSVPIIVEDASVPGGQRFNLDAFINPPTGQQGDTGRNQFRGFGAYQVDLAVQKVVRLGSGTNLRLRVDAFNALNRPVFSLPLALLGSSPFGVPTSTPASEGGAIGSLYQSGGPRTVALSARIEF